MDDLPLAYHITVGTYGMRLHGDERGTVHRAMNQPGDPIVGRNEDWQQLERGSLNFPPVVLTVEQRLQIERAMPELCRRGGWTFVTCAARPDHMHQLVRAQTDGKAVRRWLKAWVGQELSKVWPLPEGATWWAECGSVKWVWTDSYLRNVYDYIEDQRTTPRA